MTRMDNKYPDLFAASLLVAGQGDAQERLAVIGAADLAGVCARKDLLDARFHAHECVGVSARRTSRRLLELAVRGDVQRR
jgi:hypothetical protein